MLLISFYLVNRSREKLTSGDTGDGSIEELKPFLMDLCFFCNKNWHVGAALIDCFFREWIAWYFGYVEKTFTCGLRYKQVDFFSMRVIDGRSTYNCTRWDILGGYFPILCPNIIDHMLLFKSSIMLSKTYSLDIH